MTLEGDNLGDLIIGEGIRTDVGEFQENEIFFGTWEGMGSNSKRPVATVARDATIDGYGIGTIKGSFSDDGNNIRYPRLVAGEVNVNNFGLAGDATRADNELVGVFAAQKPSISHDLPLRSASYSGSLQGTTLSSHAHPGESVRGNVSLQYNFQGDKMTLDVNGLNTPSGNGGFPATISYEANCLTSSCSGDFSVRAGIHTVDGPSVHGNITDSTNNYRGDFTALGR